MTWSTNCTGSRQGTSQTVSVSGSWGVCSTLKTNALYIQWAEHCSPKATERTTDEPLKHTCCQPMVCTARAVWHLFSLDSSLHLLQQSLKPKRNSCWGRATPTCCRSPFSGTECAGEPPQPHLPVTSTHSCGRGSREVRPSVSLLIGVAAQLPSAEKYFDSCWILLIIHWLGRVIQRWHIESASTKRVDQVSHYLSYFPWEKLGRCWQSPAGVCDAGKMHPNSHLPHLPSVCFSDSALRHCPHRRESFPDARWRLRHRDQD